MSENIVLEKSVVKGLLASRKLTLDKIKELAEVSDDKVVFDSFHKLNSLAKDIALPVGAFFDGVSPDLDDGVKIGRKCEKPDAQDFRKGHLYYSHHYLASSAEEPSLMALRVKVHCSEEQNVELHKGHVCKELIYVSKGKIQVQWMGKDGKQREDVLNEGDSIFVSAYTPHSYTAIGSDEPSEIIAVNYV